MNCTVNSRDAACPGAVIGTHSSDVERKLGELRSKLHDYELKAKQIPHIKNEISQLEDQLSAALFHNPKGVKSPTRDLQDAPMPPAFIMPDVLQGEEAKKRLRIINKKLEQIKKLKELEGNILDQDAIDKINSEKELTREMECIKLGQPYVPSTTEDPHKFKVLPRDDDDIDKRTKALKKKLQQIDALKAKGLMNLDAEQKAKVDSERLCKMELSALENGESTVALREPNIDEITEKHNEEKHELERKHKALKKKMDQIATLKKRDYDSLDADQRNKLATEKDIGKEMSLMEKNISEMNKKERARVEARLN